MEVIPGGSPPAAPWPEDPGWGPPPAPRPRRRLAVVLAAALAVIALAAAGVALRPARHAAQVAAGAPAARPAGWPDPAAGVGRLLDRRARAVLGRDRAAFLATVDRRRRRYWRDQAALFERLRTVPFAAFRYRLLQPGRDLASERVRRRYAPDPVYLPVVEARYRFRGQDASPVLARFFYTFARTPVGWRIAGQGDARPARDDAEIWDAGPVQTLRTARTLVVHHPGTGFLARRLELAAERAYGQVAATWPGRWEQRVVILLPSDEAEAERLVGARDLSGVAAVASSSIESGPFERVLGNRIVVNPANVAGYDPLNLQILVTHEMTHVATRTLGEGPPLLLVEGFADYTALRPVALPLRDTRPALARQVHAGGFDGQLPTDADFRRPDAALAYDEASSFCRWLADRFGEARLRALYLAFAGPRKPSAAALDGGFRRVLGLSRQAAQARWAAWVRQGL
jgi:hypothetical protein